MTHILYGDGLHDDTAAIQERIDSGVSEVVLPAPEAFYLISRPLELPSNFRLVLPRFAEVRLAPGSNCVMVRNKMVRDYAQRRAPDFYAHPIMSHLWSYVDDYSPSAPCRNIELCGGIWNFNNQEQLPNPERGMSYSVREFYGCGMLFYNVSGLNLSGLTLKDPSQYGVALDAVSYFSVEDITFDYNDGNPYPINMDGIHLDGNCHYGVLNNLKGTCYDNLVALNAHEGSRGDITNISISNIFAEYCHSALRILVVGERIENITVTNVFGNFYQYCVGFTKAYPGESTGYIDGVSIDNIFAAKVPPVVKGDFMHPRCAPEDSERLFWFETDTLTKNVSISRCHRVERIVSQDLIRVDEGARVENLLLSEISCENLTEKPFVLLRNKGVIDRLTVRDLRNVGGELLVNEGSIGTYKEY